VHEASRRQEAETQQEVVIGMNLASSSGRSWLERSQRPARRLRVVLFRALKLGDMLCAVPALRALRGAFPDAWIVLVGLPWAREFARRFPAYIDEFHDFPGCHGLPEQDPARERMPAFLRSMRAGRFDLAIQMHGSGEITNAVVKRFGATCTAGFFSPDRPAPSGWFLPYPDHGLEVRRLLRLLEHLGIAARGEALEFPIYSGDWQEARNLATIHGVDQGRYVVIHPGASVSARCWPAERFGIVADTLAAQGLAVVLTGSAGERPLTAAVAATCSAAIDMAGRTGLGALAAVVAGARLVVCNDTGVSHLADALNVPSVVISTGDNPKRWAPADGRMHRVLCRDGGVCAHEVIEQLEELLGSVTGCIASSPTR
jgi:ADP-heptose:LPS heptosyltransferase